MGTYLVGYLVTLSALPMLLAGILWMARTDVRRTITVLSALALGIGISTALIYTLTLKTRAYNQGAFGYPPISSSGFAYFNTTQFIEQGHALALEVAFMLQTAAWVLALYHAVQARRGRWLIVIMACAAFSMFMSFVASNVNVIGVIATSPQLSDLIVTHPFGMLFVVNALASLAAAATLLYAQVGLRTVRAGGLVPGALMAPTPSTGSVVGAGVLAALATGASGATDEEDVEFVVERLPGGRG